MRHALLCMPLDNHAVQCGLCRRRCKIASGKSGYCRTRKNLDGELFSLTYGRVSSVRISKGGRPYLTEWFGPDSRSDQTAEANTEA